MNRLRRSRLSLYIFLLAGCTFFAGCGPASPDAVPTASALSLVLINGVLIDGTGSEPVPDAVLLIQGDRIVAAGKSSAITLPAQTQVIDVQGATILPGFINAHVHDAYNARNLAAWAQAGITTVRDEGILDRQRTLAKLMKLRAEEWNRPEYARLVSAGYMLAAPPNGYGHLYVRSPEDARAQVQSELDAGVDLVKFSMEDGYAGVSGLPLLSEKEIRAIVAAAHERGVPVSVHVTDARYLDPVVEAGVDDVAHMVYDQIPGNLMKQMIADDIYFVPTLTVLEAYGALESSQVNLRSFVEAGGQVAMGNDYTDVPQNGFDHFELGMPMHEIRRMAEAGLSPMQIIVAATRSAAHVCNLEQELGTLEAGKKADVLVIAGDPLRDLETLTNVLLVIHNGAIVRSEIAQ